MIIEVSIPSILRQHLSGQVIAAGEAPPACPCDNLRYFRTELDRIF
jgi:hypothetical protein